MVYGCCIFVERLCRNNDGWPAYENWRKFEEEVKKRGKREEEQKPRISSDPRKNIITVEEVTIKAILTVLRSKAIEGEVSRLKTTATA